MEYFIRTFTNLRSINGKELSTSPVTIGVVIARYNEDLSYLDVIRQFLNCYTLNFYIYNKGNPIPDNYIALENVGMCDHTYLYHIISHYDTLDDITIFLPGSCFNIKKSTLTRKLLMDASKYEYKFTAVKNAPRLSNFKIDEYKCTDFRNQEKTNKNLLVPCSIRPYGRWYEKVMKKPLTSNTVNYMGIFSVSRNRIHNHPLKLYKKLIKYVNKDKMSESSHYMERLWYNLFTSE